MPDGTTNEVYVVDKEYTDVDSKSYSYLSYDLNKTIRKATGVF